MKLILTLFIGLASSTSNRANTRMMNYQPFSTPAPINMSESDMRVNLSSFLRYHGNKSQPMLRRPIRNPDDQKLKLKIFELMKQSIYGAQDRAKHLEKLLDKYSVDIAFRLGFVFSKLDQMLIDMKSIYTYASKDFNDKNTYQVTMYEHCAKKNVEITYMVEYVIRYHSKIYDAMHNLKADSMPKPIKTG